MATQLLRCRTRWRPWERQACIRAAAPRRGLDAAAMRLLRLRTRWRPWSAKRGGDGALRRLARLQQIGLRRGAAQVP